MIVSYDKKFIFVHIPKTAGTSVSSSLLPYAGKMEKTLISRVIRKFSRIDSIPHQMVNFQNYPHWTLLRASEILPEKIFNEFYKFAFVRHPVEWQYSIFRHILRHSEIKSFQQRYGFIYQNKSFDEYIEWRIENGVIPQITQLVDQQGKLLVDEIFHYENLGNDFKIVCEKMGIKAELPHFNINKVIKPLEINQETVALIHKHYKVDFDAFGYTEKSRKQTFLFDPIQTFPELTNLLSKLNLSTYDLWHVNEISN